MWNWFHRSRLWFEQCQRTLFVVHGNFVSFWGTEYHSTHKPTPICFHKGKLFRTIWRRYYRRVVGLHQSDIAFQCVLLWRILTNMTSKAWFDCFLICFYLPNSVGPTQLCWLLQWCAGERYGNTMCASIRPILIDWFFIGKKTSSILGNILALATLDFNNVQHFGHRSAAAPRWQESLRVIKQTAAAWSANSLFSGIQEIRKQCRPRNFSF